MARAVRARRAPEPPPSASDEHRSDRPGGGNLLAPTSGLLGRRQHCHSEGSPNGQVYRVNISVTSSWADPASAAISWVEPPFILACRLRGFGKLKHLGRKTDHQVGGSKVFRIRCIPLRYLSTSTPVGPADPIRMTGVIDHTGSLSVVQSHQVCRQRSQAHPIGRAN